MCGGVEVAMPQKDQFASTDLIALPLGARLAQPQLPQLPLEPDMDFPWMFHLLHRWRLAVGAACVPLCPLCAGVAFYQGSGFTRSDIATGWRSYMLCSTGAFPHPLINVLLANMGIPIDLAPQVLVQLRPSDLGPVGHADADEEVAAAEPPGLEARNEEPQVIENFGSLWRGDRAVMAQNILSISLPCSRRLCIGSLALKDLGFTAFFCEQVNKTASTSRTRVGRYLDDQPARAPRAHVFGANNCQTDVFGRLSPDCFAVADGEATELCPFCGLPGRALRPDAISILPWEVELAEENVEEQGSGSSFHGSLWLCDTHLWGWRLRRAGVPVTVD